MKKLLCACIANMLTCGCSLVPALSSDTPVHRASNITITISEKNRTPTAWLLHRELENTLYLPGVDEPVRLEITLGDSLERLALERDGQVSRTVHFARAEYILRSADGSELARNTAHAQSGYDPAEYGFADVLAQADQREQTATQLARDIRAGLIAALRERK